MFFFGGENDDTWLIHHGNLIGITGWGDLLDQKCKNELWHYEMENTKCLKPPTRKDCSSKPWFEGVLTVHSGHNGFSMDRGRVFRWQIAASYIRLYPRPQMDVGPVCWPSAGHSPQCPQPPAVFFPTLGAHTAPLGCKGRWWLISSP